MVGSIVLGRKCRVGHPISSMLCWYSMHPVCPHRQGKNSINRERVAGCAPWYCPALSVLSVFIVNFGLLGIGSLSLDLVGMGLEIVLVTTALHPVHK